MLSKSKAKIVKKVDLVTDIGAIVYVVEIDSDVENWFITNVSSNPYFTHPPWTPILEEAVLVKKGYGELSDWKTRVIIIDETRQPIMVEHIDNINLNDPMHPLGISLKESMRRGLV
jgi:hypothetical protein